MPDAMRSQQPKLRIESSTTRRAGGLRIPPEGGHEGTFFLIV